MSVLRRAAEERYGYLLVAGLCGACFFYNLGAAGLFDFNEGLYVEAAREMLLRRDYVTGRVNGIPFYDKPPLALWLVVLSWKLFGIGEWSARLPVALSATLTTLATFWLGRKVSLRVGVLSAAFFALSPIVVGTARQMTMDIHQTWWVTAAMLSGYLALHARNGSAIAWWLAFWFCCGCGFMAKSFPGLLPIPVMALYLLVRAGGNSQERIRALFRMRPMAGLAILGAAIGPWHLAAYRAYGSFFVEEYWTLHHLGILHSTDFGHAKPFWYYVPAMGAGFFPWSFLLPLAVRQSDVGTEPGRDPLSLAGFWFVTGFVGFSLMKSKLVSYLLPIYPAAALLTASAVVRWSDRSESVSHRRNWSLPIAVSAAGLVCFLAAAAGLWWLYCGLSDVRDAEARQLLTPEMLSFVRVALITLLTGGAVVIACAWTKPAAAVPTLIAVMAVFVFVAVHSGIPAYDQAVGAPLRDVVARAGKLVRDPKELVVHIGRPRRPSVFFYLPDRLLTVKLPRNPREGIMLETYDPEPVRSAVRRFGATYVLADYDHGSETLRSAGNVDVAYRRGRWALFRVTSP